MNIFNNIKTKADYLLDRLKEAENIMPKNDGNWYDEQLLEGLNNQDFGGKLF